LVGCWLKERNLLLRQVTDQLEAQKAHETDVLAMIQNNTFFGNGKGYVGL
jgi:hypothetical protein